MIHVLLLLSSVSFAQSTGTVNLSLDNEIKIGNLGKAVRDLESGHYRQTGKPTFSNGFCFSDGSCQTSAPSGGGAGLTSTQTFSGQNTNTGQWTNVVNSTMQVFGFSNFMVEVASMDVSNGVKYATFTLTSYALTTSSLAWRADYNCLLASNSVLGAIFNGRVATNYNYVAGRGTSGTSYAGAGGTADHYIQLHVALSGTNVWIKGSLEFESLQSSTTGVGFKGNAFEPAAPGWTSVGGIAGIETPLSKLTFLTSTAGSASAANALGVLNCHFDLWRNGYNHQ